MKKIVIKILIFFLNLVSKTWRFNVKGNLVGCPSILIFWHCNLLPGWKFLSQQKENIAVVSPSKDGEYLVWLLRQWGYNFLRGSSNKNSKDVMNEIVENAKNKIISITPDGPRGPKYKIKPGAFVAAYRAQVPLQYLKIKIKWKFIFRKSWDNFQLPYLFSKIDIEISEPIYIPNNSSREDISELINFTEIQMNNEQNP